MVHEVGPIGVWGPAAVVARPDGPRPVGELNETERLGEDLPADPETDVKEKGEEAFTEREPKDEEPKNESSGCRGLRG